MRMCIASEVNSNRSENCHVRGTTISKHGQISNRSESQVGLSFLMPLELIGTPPPGYNISKNEHCLEVFLENRKFFLHQVIVFLSKNGRIFEYCQKPNRPWLNC